MHSATKSEFERDENYLTKQAHAVDKKVLECYCNNRNHSVADFMKKLAPEQTCSAKVS